ncbi:SCO family protein [Aureibaculum sp. 2210JD6-5]|uniref:SCO family protein n=1 Tax=Aureibaculum sp. 2210JD6-5 TaxID=3103957 RepID=UPI002AAC6748|nr:SCO family protein [Aureibaculum sp. 2210JD6-5]MDY7395743.1 SCO family protein [Aureibaculum sp. 2210JD6-5]
MDLSFFKKSFPTIIRIAILFVILVIVGYFLLSPKKRLPIYNPSDVNPRLVDDSVKHIKYNHKISDFHLINQNGDTVTQKDYFNKIYVADFFFTSCQTICPIMTTNMADLQKYFKNDSAVKFLSHTVTPDIDSVPVLKAYAHKKGVIDGKWNLVTGDKKQIYNLARKSYFAVLDEGDGGKQDFIHTEQFVLVDKNKQIRGFYDGTNKEEIQQIIEDIQLLKENE